MERYEYLVIGGGMTAAEALNGIREADPDGRIALLGAEPHRPYDRPPLSKALWKEDGDEDAIWRSIPEDADLRLGRRAVGLDLNEKTVSDGTGATHAFDRLLLATGGTPRTLPGSSDRVIYFRTLDDYRRLREAATEAAHVLVIGGGFIGTEIAAALSWSGVRVTMLVPEAGLGARQYPADLSTFLAEYYREKGVDVRLGETVAEVANSGEGVRVRTGDGAEIEADLAVAGIGIVPEVGLASSAGIAVENGIVVDEMLRTSHPDVYAAGDVAFFHNPALGRRVRVEHEDNAKTMGRHAGRSMAGASEPYHHLPFFYSDLFDLGYEAVGDLDARLETVSDWKDPFREGVVYYLSDDRVRGVLLWNTWGQVDAARALIAEPGPFRAEDLKGRLS